mgnify:CR=1 FL=1|tara:strand:- start:3069 stop:3929 length:861 start_codon:yes stop_codon:yes gene_type:complete
MGRDKPSFDGLINDVAKGPYYEFAGKPLFIKPPDIEVLINSHGYRSDEFRMGLAQKNYLFSGCSFTWGAGLPEGKSWANVVNNNLGKDKIFNLGLIGQSINSIVANVYRYIRSYGPPEAIFLLLPGLDRHEHVHIGYDPYLNRKFAITTASMLGHFEENGLIKNKEEFDFLSNVFYPEDHLLYQAANQMKVLEEYLEMKGIPLLWSTWDIYLVPMLDNFNVFNNYFKMPVVSTEWLHENEPKDVVGKKYWARAGDAPAHHPGMGEQIHFANNFVAEFKKRKYGSLL